MSLSKDVCHTMRSLLNALLMTFACGLAGCTTNNTPSSTTAPTPTPTPATGTVPVVTAVSPSSGDASGGTSVAITGSGFTGATQVLFGSLTAGSLAVNSDTSITATSPAATAGTLSDITVTTPSGTSLTGSADLFSWGQNNITSFTPSAMSVKSGTPVNITASFLYQVPSAVTLPISAVTNPPGSTAFLVPIRVNVPAAATTVTFQIATFFVSSPQSITVSTIFDNITQVTSFTITS
jgi:hypothetical protein